MQGQQIQQYSNHSIDITHKINKEQQANKIKYRLQLFAQTALILSSSLMFGKLIVFSHYGKINIPIKLFFLYIYTATLDPLVIWSGYTATRLYEGRIRKIQAQLS